MEENGGNLAELPVTARTIANHARAMLSAPAESNSQTTAALPNVVWNRRSDSSAEPTSRAIEIMNQSKFIMG